MQPVLGAVYDTLIVYHIEALASIDWHVVI